MQLTKAEVLLLINTLDASLDYYKDVNVERYHQLLALQQKVDDYYHTEIARIKTRNQRVIDKMNMKASMRWTNIK
jgi:hypothetical protein